MKRFVAMALVLALSGAVSMARADDKKEEKKGDGKANPTGTWKWEVERNGQKRTVTLKLKAEGDKLTGGMPGRNNQETAIEDGSFKDGTVTFKVTRTNQQGTKVTTKYTGKIEGDTMKLKIEREGADKPTEVEAKRSGD